MAHVRTSTRCLAVKGGHLLAAVRGSQCKQPLADLLAGGQSAGPGVMQLPSKSTLFYVSGPPDSKPVSCTSYICCHCHGWHGSGALIIRVSSFSSLTYRRHQVWHIVDNIVQTYYKLSSTKHVQYKKSSISVYPDVAPMSWPSWATSKVFAFDIRISRYVRSYSISKKNYDIVVVWTVEIEYRMPIFKKSLQCRRQKLRYRS